MNVSRKAYKDSRKLTLTTVQRRDVIGYLVEIFYGIPSCSVDNANTIAEVGVV